MLRSVLLLLAGVLMYVTGFAQSGTINGKVTSKASHNPLAKASVFLSNATVGTISGEDGTFTLSGIRPGQYDLVVSMIGYEDYVQSVLVGKEPLSVNIELTPKITELREVVITNGGNWKLNYANFLKDFIGDSPDGKKCKILNPTDLVLVNHKTKRYLEGHSYDFLDIENNALGYKLRILLKEFKTDQISRIISWQGKVLFQEMQGSAAQKAKWAERRREIYYGSTMHFLRSLIANNIDQQGFQMMILQRAPNPQRADEAVILQKLDKFQQYPVRDSIRFWNDQYNMPKYENNLIRKLLNPFDVVRSTDKPGLYALVFPDNLYVIYTKRHETMDFKDLYRPLDMENFETSVISLYTPYTIFDNNGVVIAPHSVLYEGTWSMSKVAEMLPVDYVPDDIKN